MRSNFVGDVDFSGIFFHVFFFFLAARTAERWTAMEKGDKVSLTSYLLQPNQSKEVTTNNQRKHVPSILMRRLLEPPFPRPQPAPPTSLIGNLCDRHVVVDLLDLDLPKDAVDVDGLGRAVPGMRHPLRPAARPAGRRCSGVGSGRSTARADE